MKPTKQIISLGLSANQLAVIYHLGNHGATKLADVAKSINLTTAALTSISDGLDAKGLVTRDAHTTDRRIKMLSLTKEGKKLANLL